MFVPVSQPFFDRKEKSLVLVALKRKEISGFSGSFVSQFENEFAQFCGVKYGVSTTSGTTALHLALATLGLGPRDEVLVSTLTNMATFFSVFYQGAKPVPIDCDARTLNIDPSLLEAKITPRTKAILVVHLYGHPVDMDPVLAVAKKYNLFVVEDAAEAHGAEYKGKKIGSLGDIGCFSFYANKIITTGEGGMITTNNQNWADKARSLKSLAFGDTNKFLHKYIGFNYRLSNLQAAIGVAQMKKINKIIKLKRAMAEYYIKELKDVEGVQLPVEEPYAFNVYWMFNIILRGKLAGQRDVFMAELQRKGVETREDFVPFNQQEIFLKQGLVNADDCPVANSLYQDGLYLPSGAGITKKELKYVVAKIKEVVNALQ